MHPVLIAGYIALFASIGVAFLAVNLIVGWLVRPRAPNAEKLEVYECGEPTIGCRRSPFSRACGADRSKASV